LAKITNAQMSVLINCIGAVETGGQVFGCRRYDDYTTAYTNSSAEDSITIGAFQEFKGYAKALLQEIKDTYPKTFSKYDNADIVSDLKKSSWSGYSPAKGSAKAKAIVNIISSDDGKKVQDTRIVKLLNQYIEYAESLGVTEVDALFMCANFIHQGGNSACKRLVGKISKPYTLDKLYNATLSDTGNQVGVYKSRQKLMYQWIKQYITNATSSTGGTTTGGTKMTENELRSKVASWLSSYVGISEGSAKHKEILAYFNNSKLSTRYTMTIYDAWCATAVSATFIVLGLAGKSGSGSLFECCECSCWYMIEAAKKQGIWVENDAYTPKTGDVILYDWDDSGSGDNQGNPDHVGIVVSVSGSTIRVIEGNMNNTVGYRNIQVNGRYIRGYITPKYSNFATGSSNSNTQTPVATVSTELKIGSNGSAVKTMQTMLIKCGYSCGSAGADGDFGNATLTALKNFQKANGLTVDGVYGTNTKKALEAAYAEKTKSSTTTSSSSSGLNRTVKWTGVVTADELNVRTWAGTENSKCSFSPLKRNTQVGICDSVKDKNGDVWYYIKSGSKYGFVHSGWIKKK